jgi:hypothetical protein
MALEKCPHCPERVRKGSLDLHLRRCINYRRKVKREMSAIPEEPIPIESEVIQPGAETPQKKKRGRPKKT